MSPLRRAGTAALVLILALGAGDAGSRRGLLVMNHEYTDDGLLHATGLADWSAEKVRKAQAAHGVSVTDACISLAQTVPVLQGLAAAVQLRRGHANPHTAA